MWTREVPKQDGYYWFIGWPYGKDEDNPRCIIVQVLHGLMIVDNAFTDESEMEGWFARAVMPIINSREVADWLIQAIPR